MRLPVRPTPWCLALLAACAPAPPPAAPAGAPAILRDCEVPGVAGRARCGTLHVRENRAARTGRTIPLRIVVLPATGPAPAPDPLVFFSGGPGQAATDSPGNLPFIGIDSTVRRDRDVLLVDQRGTGGSNPLGCALSADTTALDAYLGDSFPVETVRACLASLAGRADVTQYTNEAAVADLEEVRAALGYERLNLVGVSYGTRTALNYMRRHPGRVRSTILFSTVPPGFAAPLPFPRAAQDALDSLAADCAADPGCSTAFPRFGEEFRALVERLERGPVRVTALNPATRRPEEATLSHGEFGERVRSMLYSPQSAALLPLLVHRAHRGDWSPFASLAADMRYRAARGATWGLFLAMTCAEDVPLTLGRDVDSAAANTFGGAFRIRRQQAACAGWPRAELPADFHDPVRADVPTLLVSGAADPVTPARHAERVAAALPRSRHVVVPHAAHVPTGPCISRIVARFIATASPGEVDASCVRENRRPPFAVELPEWAPGARALSAPAARG